VLNEVLSTAAAPPGYLAWNIAANIVRLCRCARPRELELNDRASC